MWNEGQPPLTFTILCEWNRNECCCCCYCYLHCCCCCYLQPINYDSSFTEPFTIDLLALAFIGHGRRRRGRRHCRHNNSQNTLSTTIRFYDHHLSTSTLRRASRLADCIKADWKLQLNKNEAATLDSLFFFFVTQYFLCLALWPFIQRKQEENKKQLLLIIQYLCQLLSIKSNWNKKKTSRYHLMWWLYINIKTSNHRHSWPIVSKLLP